MHDSNFHGGVIKIQINLLGKNLEAHKNGIVIQIQ